MDNNDAPPSVDSTTKAKEEESHAPAASPANLPSSLAGAFENNEMTRNNEVSAAADSQQQQQQQQMPSASAIAEGGGVDDSHTAATTADAHNDLLSSEYDDEAAVTTTATTSDVTTTSVSAAPSSPQGVGLLLASSLPQQQQQQQQQSSSSSHVGMSRPSSLSSKSRYSGLTAVSGTASALNNNNNNNNSANNNNNVNRPHAYFASSEEESEAELTENDSHSSADRIGGGGMNKHYHHLQSSLLQQQSQSPHQQKSQHQQQRPSGILSSSSKRLTEIAVQSTNQRKPKFQQPLSSELLPPPTVTVQPAAAVAAGGGSTTSGATATANNNTSLSSPTFRPQRPVPHHTNINHNLHHNNHRHRSSIGSSGTNNSNNNNNNNNNIMKNKTNKKKKHHKHLPRGLPVFKDSRACMWTSTHDANAPSEDRYSSLVNVLLRPPKTTQILPKGKSNNNNDDNDISEGGGVGGKKKSGEDATNENNNNGEGGGGSKCCSQSESESMTDGGEENQQQQQQQQNTSNDPNNTEDDEDNTSLIRLSLWSVIDGHGGGCVATYAAEVLLPHIAASVARALKSEIVDRGVCNVNGQLRDANALDLDGLIRSSDRSRYDSPVDTNIGGGGGGSVVGGTSSTAGSGGGGGSGRKNAVDRQREAGIDVVNPNSIHYRSPYEDSGSEGECQGVEDQDDDHASRGTKSTTGRDGGSELMSRGGSESKSEAESEAPVSVASSLLPGNPICANSHEESASSVKTSVKTAVSPVTQHAPVGTHSPAEVAAITRAITDSFLAVDEGWINSIDPVTTHQTSCVSNGRWNAGACALVVFTVQRLDWCRNSRVDHETHHRERGARGFEDTSHNKDAARRRKLDYATKSKSVSSLSTLSSTSSITTEANTTEMLGEESEITETEDDYDNVSDIFGPHRRRRKKAELIDDIHNQEGTFIPTLAGCKCHYYRPNDAMLYTAHVGDCRAVMLGSAPPRTIKVPPEGHSHSLDHGNTSEDTSSSESIADEISSSDHDSDSSEDMDFMGARGGPADGMFGYVRRSKRQRRSDNNAIEHQQPFVPLPPLDRRGQSSEESAIESDDSTSTTHESFNRDSSVIRGGRGRVARVDVVHVNSLEEDKLLETEDEEEIKEIRSVRSGSPTQMDRATSPTATEPTQLVADPVHPPPSPLSMLMRPIDLTTDHSAYNPAEVTAVLRRCNNAPKAISSSTGGGIKRVAGSLAVTRALGDAYLKTPRLSFFPYKRHAPYITARPEVNCRVITKGADRILILASDGVWERAAGDDVLRWVRNYYNARIAGVKEQHLHPPLYAGGVEEHPYGEIGEITKRISRRKYGNRHSDGGDGDEEMDGKGYPLGNDGSGSDECTAEKRAADLTPSTDSTKSKDPSGNTGTEEKLDESDAATLSENTTGTGATTTADETAATAKTGTKRKYPGSTGSESVSTRSSTASSRLGGRRTRRHRSSRPYSLEIPTVSEVIVRKVLNKVRKARNISSLRMLMSLPKGRARRSKHDDITASVVDLSGFVS